MNENEDKRDSSKALFFRNDFSSNHLYMLIFEFEIYKPNNYFTLEIKKL
jgi:hypothetical protein